MTNPGSTISPEQWQSKVEELQAQHQLELLQQQEEHLRLLQQLKAQLLQDIADTNASDSSQLLQALLKEKVSSQTFCHPVGGLPIFGDPLQSYAEFQPISLVTHSGRGTTSPSSAFAVSCTPSPTKTNDGQRCDTIVSIPHTPTRISTPECPSFSISHTPQHNSLPTQLPTSCERPSYQTPSANTSELRRVALLEKHARHIEDLKHYYESELSELRQQLEEARSGREGIACSAGNPLPLGPKDYAGSVESDKLSAANTRLQSQCSELQRLHEEGMRERQTLEVQLHRLQHYAERYESSEKRAGTLQERLEATRSNLEQQEELVKSLRQELAGLRMELDSYQEQRAQDLESVEQLLKEFEVLQHEDEQLHETNTSLENTVAGLNQEVSSLRATLSKCKSAEAQYKSTISSLEDEVRHLRHVNNRLHGQMTHYSLSDVDVYSKTGDSNHSPRAANSTSSRQRLSPYCQAVTPTSRTPPTDEQGSSTQRLTRRKWLEPSEPGLIFGKGPLHDEENQVPQSKAKGRSPSYIGLEDLEGGTPSAQRRDKGDVSPDGMTADLAESSLRSIRSGNILARDPNGQQTYRKSKADLLSTKKFNADVMSLEERVEKNMQVVAKAEQKMAELQKEKEQLQSALQRIPHSGRTALRDKQDQLQMESRLDEVDKEIGAMRMTLRNHHAL